jgi:hypothetical protein
VHKIFPQKPQKERKCHARLALNTARRSGHLRGAVSKHHQQKTCFLLSIKEVFSGRLTIPPCCIQREADELAALIFAVFVLKSYDCPVAFQTRIRSVSGRR